MGGSGIKTTENLRKVQNKMTKIKGKRHRKAYNSSKEVASARARKDFFEARKDLFEATVSTSMSPRQRKAAQGLAQ